MTVETLHSHPVARYRVCWESLSGHTDRSRPLPWSVAEFRRREEEHAEGLQAVWLERCEPVQPEEGGRA